VMAREFPGELPDERVRQGRVPNSNYYLVEKDKLSRLSSVDYPECYIVLE